MFCVYSVDIMASKLDPENLGIITQCSFMEEFFAGEKPQEVPKSFSLYHYNGLPRSCHENKVIVDQSWYHWNPYYTTRFSNGLNSNCLQMTIYVWHT